MNQKQSFLLCACTSERENKQESEIRQKKKKRKEEMVDTRTNLLPEVRFTNEQIRHRVNKQWRLIKLNTITSLVKIINIKNLSA